MVGPSQQTFPNYGTFRLQMLKVLARFSHIAERNTKSLSPVLLNLYRLILIILLVIEQIILKL